MHSNPVGQFINELSIMLDKHPDLDESRLATLVIHGNAEEKQTGALLAAVQAFRNNRQTKALQYLELIQNNNELLPLPALLWMISLRDTLKQAQKIPADFLTYAQCALDKEQYVPAAEAASLAMVEDAKRWLNLIYDPAANLRAASIYETIAQQLPRIERESTQQTSKTRIGLIVPNLVDNIVAYSNRVVFFARYLDHMKYELFVYSSENMCQRLRMLPFPYAAPSSKISGAKYLAELRERNVPVYLTPHDQDIITAAQTLATKIATDQIDILLIQSGTTMPLDWIASRIAPVPVKMQIHIGLSALQPELDATLFDNKSNMLREQNSWPKNGGDVLLMRRGTDIDLLDQQRAAPREQFGIPDHAIVIGLLSNYLNTRLSPEYLQVIAETLARHPEAWFTAIGGSEMPEHALAFFREAGVLSHVSHIAARRDGGSILKMMDIYASEFPASGSQSVVEAMACGLPVAAMCVGNTHYASIGGDLVGHNAVISEATPDAYAAKLSEWISNPVARKTAARAMRKRAEEYFHVQTFITNVCNKGQEYLAAKTRSNP